MKGNRFVAFFLSFFVSGLGQIYNDQLSKGLLFYTAVWAVLVVSKFLDLFASFSGALASTLLFIVLGLYIPIDAFLQAGRQEDRKPAKSHRVVIVVAVMIISEIMLLFNPWVEDAVNPYKSYTTYQVMSPSMTPVLAVGDRIISREDHYRNERPDRGDVVVYSIRQGDAKHDIKRVIGLPGETIEIRDKKVLINNHYLDEPYVMHADPLVPGINSTRDNYGPTVIPPDSFFLMGDSRDKSFDSRFTMPVQLKRIEGKALYIYWSSDHGRIGASLR